MADLHLAARSEHDGRLAATGMPGHTDCLLYLCCSSRRTTMSASRRCLFFSSYSSACSFNLACCFFSMSVRRLCAVEDELWDKVPSRAPNNLCPRLRSSI